MIGKNILNMDRNEEWKKMNEANIMTLYNQSELKQHVGHKIVCRIHREKYVDEKVTIECETCHEILYSGFKYCQNCGKRLNEYGECTNPKLNNYGTCPKSRHLKMRE